MNSESIKGLLWKNSELRHLFNQRFHQLLRWNQNLLQNNRLCKLIFNVIQVKFDEIFENSQSHFFVQIFLEDELLKMRVKIATLFFDSFYEVPEERYPLYHVLWMATFMDVELVYRSINLVFKKVLAQYIERVDIQLEKTLIRNAVVLIGLLLFCLKEAFFLQ